MASDRTDASIGLRCTWGIFLIAFSLIVALSLFSYDWRDVAILKAPPNQPSGNLIGPVGAWLSFGLFAAFGVGAHVVTLWCVLVGLVLIVRRAERIWPQVLWSTVFALSLAALTDLCGGEWAQASARALNVLPDPGGLLGRMVTRAVLIRWLSPVGTGILLGALLAASAVMIFGFGGVMRVVRASAAGARFLFHRARTAVIERQVRRQRAERDERKLEKQRQLLEQRMRLQEQAAGLRVRPRPATPAAEPRAETPPEPARPQPPPAPPEPEPPEPEPLPASAPAKRGGPAGRYVLPPLSLLDPEPASGGQTVKTDTATAAKILVETLADFGIQAEVTNFEEGPVVTRYELLPAPGVRVERISGLSNNLALSLKATSVRVQAPIPGKGVVGIEVPNTTAQLVSLRQILEGKTWKAGKARLPLVLGQDVGGTDLIADLSTMPHVLIAGATGSGKTVCMNSVLAGLLMGRSPAEMRLLLVDPKIVEFSVFNHLPHLVVPVITDPKKVGLGLRWAINEMERRYKLFAKAGVRNIEGYNGRLVATQAELFESPSGDAPPDEAAPQAVPYIVIVIDELADLMLSDQAEIENCVARLAQLSRAVGIHMILSTQRPSVNVITGTIKANFPARIAFQVAQKVDSRTILDTVGAEKLLGRGDMLFLPPGSSKMVRAQGAITTDGEIRRIVEFIKEQGPPSYEMEIHEKIEKPGEALDDETEDEDLLNQSIAIIRETRRASTSSLQRRLRIGYTRAARIMDILEERGIVGPPKGSDPREILIDLDGGISDYRPPEASEET